MKYLFFVIVFCFSGTLQAQTALDRGRPAPDDGVFYNNKEAAKLLVERETAQLKCDISIDTEKKRSLVIHEGEKQKAEIILQGEKDKCKILLDAKDKQIGALLAELEKEQADNSIWWFLGGVTAGTVGSIFIFFAATQVSSAPNILGGR